jgi:CubicO group peptidase (beta-lactamase class C family)
MTDHGSTRAALDPHRLDAAFDLVAHQVASGEVGVAGVAVARGDGPVRSVTVGPDGQTFEHRFLVASITKPITATAILQLVEDGRVDLDRPLAADLPGFRPPPAVPGQPGGESITPWHILTHTSGLQDGGEELVVATRPTAAELIRRVSTQPLLFPPGTAFHYASDSFYLLAELAARAGGRPFTELLRERIFRPLAMDATTFDPFDPSEGGPEPFPLGGLFERYGPLRAEATRYFVSLGMPGGGLWSTTSDLVRFGRAMLGGGALDGARILGDDSVGFMTREHTGNVLEAGTPPRQPHHGLGWALPGREPGSPASAGAYGHGGATASRLIVDPAWDLVVVYLRNEWGGDTAPTDALVDAVYAALDRPAS